MAKTVSLSSSEDNSDNGIQFEAQVCESESNETPKTPDNTKASSDFRILDFLRKHIAIVSVCALGIVTVLLIVAIIILLQRKLVPITVTIVSHDTNTSQEEENLDRLEPLPQAVMLLGAETNLSNFKVILRQEWSVQPPIRPLNRLQTPVPYVIIHHTATENCSSQAVCISHLRSIQTLHIETRDWLDTAYNFLVGGDGKAYEGRGWTYEGTHTNGYDSRSIGIAFIGTFNNFKPPEEQIFACKQLIAEGVEMGYIDKDYQLLFLGVHEVNVQ